MTTFLQSLYGLLVVETQSEEISKQLERNGADLEARDPKAFIEAFKSLGTLGEFLFGYEPSNGAVEHTCLEGAPSRSTRDAMYYLLNPIIFCCAPYSVRNVVLDGSVRQFV